MRLPSTIPAAILAAVLGVACADTGAYVATGPTGVYAGAYTPDLVTVSPGVSVIAGYNEPVFYSNNYYWRYANNGWYRSPYYNRGWVYATPPYAVSRIDRPWTYRNYRAPYGYNRGGYYRDGRYYNNRYDNRYNDRNRYDNRYNTDHRYRTDQRSRYDQQQRIRDQQRYRSNQRQYDQRTYREQGSYSGDRYQGNRSQ